MRHTRNGRAVSPRLTLLIAAALVAGCHDTPLATGPGSAPSAARYPITGLALEMVSTGLLYTCGIAKGGQALCWGSNNVGQLGDGTLQERSVPAPVASAVQFTAITAGGGGPNLQSHVCAIAKGGRAWCWGDNTYGQLGDNTIADRIVPWPVWDSPEFISISAGVGHTCGVAKGGTAYCWGRSDYGQLGTGTASTWTPTPVLGNLSFVSVSAGNGYSCAVTKAGDAYCWGYNGNGELGDGTNAERGVPTLVTGGHSFRLIAVSNNNGTYGGHTCGLTTSGAVLCWGLNHRGQLGNTTTSSSPVPVPVVGGHTFTSISVGSVHTCGIIKGGSGACWGGNFFGTLGDGTAYDRSFPVSVLGEFEFVALEGGYGQTCGITKGMGTWCWGGNQAGELGNGTTVDSYGPIPVTSP